MATDESALREHVIAQAVRSIPEAFLREVNDRFPRAYAEEFAELAHKPARLPEQRIFNLIQDRCFRIDWELSEAARAHGLPYTVKPLPANSWRHTYVTSGGFGLTQSYVQRTGDLPQPARFRDRLAEAARCPRLPIDDPAEIYAIREFYALLAHNPVGRGFTEEEQRLGSLMFCLPDSGMKGWAVEISVPELLSHYPAVARPRIERGPSWKRGVDRRKESK